MHKIKNSNREGAANFGLKFNFFSYIPPEIIKKPNFFLHLPSEKNSGASFSLPSFDVSFYYLWLKTYNSMDHGINSRQKIAFLHHFFN